MEEKTCLALGQLYLEKLGENTPKTQNMSWERREKLLSRRLQSWKLQNVLVMLHSRHWLQPKPQKARKALTLGINWQLGSGTTWQPRRVWLDINIRRILHIPRQILQFFPLGAHNWYSVTPTGDLWRTGGRKRNFQTPANLRETLQQ